MKLFATTLLLSIYALICGPALAKDPASSLFADKSIQPGEKVEHLYRSIGLPWYEATRVYRSASKELKSEMCHYVIGHYKERFHGMTRNMVINTLGKPDAIWEEDPGPDLVYTGEGYVSDAMSGYIFQFDANDKVKHIVSAN